MSSKIVFASYRPFEGKSDEFKKLLFQHTPTLQSVELATDRTPIIALAKDGTFLEIFEWSSEDAAARAHQHPTVAKFWERMSTLGDFMKLNSIQEFNEMFPHFEPVQRQIQN